ncbi:MAG: hypothetical protein AAB516_01925 [Patescibacteria group bacterium]
MTNKIIFIILLFVLCFFSFSAVFAANIDYKYPWKGETTPSGLVNRIYIYALSVVGAVAMGVLVYGGILHTISAGNSSKQQDAKEWITGAIWGLALLLGAYLILWTINPDLVSLKDPVITGIFPGGGGGQFKGAGTSGSWGPTTPAPGTLSDQQAKSQLQQGMVSYKPNVSFDNIKQTTINEAKALSFDLQNKGVGIGNETITSGTEGTHNEGTYSHANGYKFDLRINNDLTNFIEKNYTLIGTRSDGAPQYQNSRGAIYAKEGDHWDVLVRTEG